ncbi:MAG TPA: 1,4-alpha-glucan branching protein [Trebonia sp.]
MAIIERTTMVPGKLKLLTSWLPGRPWYAGEATLPQLTKAGGFRLDDPDGEVGLEFMAVTDDSGDEPVTYLVPVTYRGIPLAGGDGALIGTAEHGVLGKRWIYDGTRDPVLVTQMFALLLGEAEPQAQSISNTVDPSVTRAITGNTGALPVEIADVTDQRSSTDVIVRPTSAARPLMLRVNRVLRPNAPGLMTGSLGHITAEWAGAAAPRLRGRFIVLRIP